MKRLAFLILAAVILSGCFGIGAQLGGVAGATGSLFAARAVSPAQVARCRSLQHRHDTWSVVATVSGGVAAGAGAATGAINGSTEAAEIGHASAIGTGIVGGILGAIGSAMAGSAASDFTALGCPAVLAGAP